MQNEVDDITADSKKFTQADISKDRDIRLKLRHKLLAYMLKNYL
jgi:hypothetical protein